MFVAGIWQTSATMITGFLGWLLILLISRADIGLGANGVGVYNMGVVFFSTFTILLLGIKKSTSQKISENCMNDMTCLKEAKNGIFAIFIVCIIMGIGLVGVSFFIGPTLTFQNELSSLLFLIGIFLFIVWHREGSQSILAGLGEYDKIAKSNLLCAVTQLVVVILLILIIKLTYLPVTLVFIAFGLGIIAQILLLHIYIKRHQLYHSIIFQFYSKNVEIYRNIRQGFSFTVTEIVPFNFLASISLLILFLFTQNFAISGAYSIVIGFAIGGLSITNFTWPLITHIAEAYGKGDFERIQYNLRLVLKIFYYMTFFILVIFIGAAQGILLMFYGETYLTGITDIWIPFMLVMFASSIAGFEYVMCSVLLGVGKRKPAAINIGLLFLLTIGFSISLLWLHPFNPQINVSLGYLIATLVMLPVLPYLLKKQINQKIPFSIGLRSLFAFLCTFLVCFILVWPPLNLLPISNFFVFIFLFPILSIIYLIFLVFFGSISQKDFELLEKKLEDYRVKRYLILWFYFFRKIMRSSPFCKSNSLIFE